MFYAIIDALSGSMNQKWGNRLHRVVIINNPICLLVKSMLVTKEKYFPRTTSTNFGQLSLLFLIAYVQIGLIDFCL